MKIKFAKAVCSGVIEHGHSVGVVLGNVVMQNARPCGRKRAAAIEHILHAIRNAMQLAAARSVVQFSGPARSRVLEHLGKGFADRIEIFRAFKAGSRQVRCCRIAVFHSPGQGRD